MQNCKSYPLPTSALVYTLKSGEINLHPIIILTSLEDLGAATYELVNFVDHKV